MKFRFKVQTFQTDAVDAVVDCFKGQPPSNGLRYRIDPGVVKTGQTARLEMDEGFRNNDLALPLPDILKKIQSVQVRQNLPVSNAFKQTKVSAVNLDIEMEKHVYFVAEMKGAMSSMEIRSIEETKIKCAQKFFAKITSDQVKYDVVNSYSMLMELAH